MLSFFCARHRHRQYGGRGGAFADSGPYRVSISLSSNLGCFSSLLFYFFLSDNDRQRQSYSDNDNYNYSVAVHVGRGRQNTAAAAALFSIFGYWIGFVLMHFIWNCLHVCLTFCRPTPCTHPLLSTQRRPLIAAEKCLALQLVNNIC